MSHSSQEAVESLEFKGQSRRLQVFALALGRGLCAVTGLLSAAVLSRLLTKGEYATYRQTFLTYSFVAPFLSLGIHEAVFYFLAGDKAQFRSRLSGAATILSLAGLLFGIFLIVGGNRLLASRFSNEALEGTVLALLPYFPLYLVLGLVDPAMVTLGRATQLAAFSVVSRLLIATTVIITCVLWRQALAPVLGNVLMSCIVAVSAVWLVSAHSPRGSWMPSFNSSRQLLLFSIPLGLASMIGTMTVELGKVIVSSLCTTEEFAVYINGAMDIPIVGIVTGSISSVLMVDMRRALADGRRDETVELFRRIAAKTALFIFPTFFFVMLGADWLVQVLFSAQYADSALPLRIYALILPVRVCFYGPLLVAAGKPKVVMYRALVGLFFTAVLTVVLVRRMGYLGAAAAAVVVTYAWHMTYNLYFIARHFGIPLGRVLPFSDLGRIAIFTGLPALALAAVSLLWEARSAGGNLLSFGIAYWLIIGVWWNRRLYSAHSVLRKLESIWTRGRKV